MIKVLFICRGTEQLSTGIEISPIIKNEDQYEYRVNTLPFYRNVKKEDVIFGRK